MCVALKLVSGMHSYVGTAAEQLRAPLRGFGHVKTCANWTAQLAGALVRTRVGRILRWRCLSKHATLASLARGGEARIY